MLLQQYQIFRKKQTVDSAAFNSDTLVDAAVTVYPVYIIYYEEEWWQYTPLSKSNIHYERLWFNLPTRTQTSGQISNDFAANNRQPSTPYSRSTPKAFHVRSGVPVACFLVVSNTRVDIFDSQDVSTIDCRAKMCSAVLRPERKQHWKSNVSKRMEIRKVIVVNVWFDYLVLAT